MIKIVFHFSIKIYRNGREVGKPSRQEAAPTSPAFAVGLNVSEDRRTIDSYDMVKVK